MATSTFLSQVEAAASLGFFEMVQKEDFSTEELRQAIEAGCKIVKLNHISWANPSCYLYEIAYKAHHSCG